MADVPVTDDQPSAVPQCDLHKLANWQTNSGNIWIMEKLAADNEKPELVNCMSNVAWAQASASELPDVPVDGGEGEPAP